MTTRRIIATMLAVAIVLGIGLGIAVAEKPTDDGGVYNGNGAPSGPHFNLNIIGVDNPKTAEMKDGSGRVIFVNLSGKTKINLQEGPYAVIDKNGTDSDGALFQLPNPDPDYDGMTSYSVWARACGKPGDGVKVIITTGAEVDGETVYSIDPVEVTRPKGQRLFEDVSRQLLYIYVDITDDDVDNPKRYPLFDPRLEGYFWDYDNYGMKLLQLRFYEIPSGPYGDIADPPPA